jgi:Tfp pilus assembly protein PilV
MRHGIVLLEALLAAAVLAVAALALATIADRYVARQAYGGALTAASQAAEALVAEAQMRHDMRAGSDQGALDGLPGATYSREVTAAGGAAGTDVYRVAVRISYSAGGQARTFDLEKWVVSAHER